MSVLRKYNDQSEALDLLSKDVVDCLFQVHKKLGPGYIEKIYEDCFCIEAKRKQLNIQRQYLLKMEYDDEFIPTEFRLDLVVENQILLELKAVERIHPVHEAQIYSYLKMSGLSLGFLVNFNVPLIKDGIKRYVPKNLRNFGSSR